MIRFYSFIFSIAFGATLCAINESCHSDTTLPLAGETLYLQDSEELATNQPVYIGVRHSELFTLLALKFNRRVVGGNGIWFSQAEAVGASLDSSNIRSLSLTILPTIAEARRLITDQASLSSAFYSEQGVDIASWHIAWIQGSNVTLMLREVNLALCISWRGNPDAAKQFARNLVSLLRENRDVSSIGAFALSPRIEILRVGLSSTKEGQIECLFRPEFGLSNKSSALTGVATMESATARIPAQSLDSGEMILCFPKAFHGKTVRISVVNEENVLISDIITLKTE